MPKSFATVARVPSVTTIPPLLCTSSCSRNTASASAHFFSCQGRPQIRPDHLRGGARRRHHRQIHSALLASIAGTGARRSSRPTWMRLRVWVCFCCCCAPWRLRVCVPKRVPEAPHNLPVRPLRVTHVAPALAYAACEVVHCAERANVLRSKGLLEALDDVARMNSGTASANRPCAWRRSAMLSEAVMVWNQSSSSACAAGQIAAGLL